MDSSFFRRHRKKTLFLVIAVLGLSGLFGAEAILAWSNTSPWVGTRRAIRLREHKPNTDLTLEIPMELIRDSDSLPLGEIHFATDGDGFIKPSRIHDDPDLTVVFVGGSTTECMWVREASRFPYLVGRLLDKDGHFGKVNSYNASMAGNNSIHTLCAMLGKIVPLQPEIVVMMHNANDLIVLLHNETYWTTLIATRSIVTVGPQNSALGRTRGLLRHVLPNVYEIFSPTYVKDELRKLRGQRAKVDPMFIESHFRKSLTAFIRICEVWDIKPALMTLASRLTEEPLHESLSFLPAKLKRDFGLEYHEYRRLFHRLNDVVREVGRENDVMVIDLAAQIPSDGKHLYDFYHLNNEGSELAARIIADKLMAGR